MPHALKFYCANYLTHECPTRSNSRALMFVALDVLPFWKHDQSEQATVFWPFSDSGFLTQTQSTAIIVTPIIHGMYGTHQTIETMVKKDQGIGLDIGRVYWISMR